MKSNVTNIRHKGQESFPHATRAVRLLSLSEENLLGWLIYRPDTDEFLHSHIACVGCTTARYVKTLEYAYCFSSEALAFRYSMFIDKPTDVVKLYDNGDKLVVLFDK